MFDIAVLWFVAIFIISASNKFVKKNKIENRVISIPKSDVVMYRFKVIYLHLLLLVQYLCHINLHFNF